MKTQNKVQLIGYAGHEPQVKEFSSGSKKATLNLATHHPVKKQNGEREWITTWHKVIAWNERAEYLADNFIKGSHLMVEGSLIYRTYEDKQGHTRYVTEIRANFFVNLDR